MAFPPCRALLACLATLAIGACRSAAAPPQEDGYVLAFLVRGPSAAERTPEEKKTIQAAHLANIGRLAKERKLVVAGPFGKPVPDESLRGIFVFVFCVLCHTKNSVFYLISGHSGKNSCG